MTREELISWRKQRGINQGQVADLLRVSRQTVISWERGRYAIPDDLELRLSRAAPVESAKRHDREGRITPAAFPHLYHYQRDIMRHIPSSKHPIMLARRGLLGWRGLAWFYANVSSCIKPRAELLETDHYAAALEDLEADRKHPAVEAVKRWFMDGTLLEGITIDKGDPWPILHLNEVVAPWEGYNNPYPPPPLTPGGPAPTVLVRPPLPASYYWSKDNKLVFVEEGET